MRGDEKRPGCRTDPHGNQGCNAGDDAVKDNGNAGLCRAQTGTGHAGNFKTAQGGKHRNGVRCVRMIHLDASPDDLNLSRKPFIRQAGAAAGDHFRRQV